MNISPLLCLKRARGVPVVSRTAHLAGFVAITLMILFFAVSCSKSSAQANTKSEVVAKVNGTPITAAELQVQVDAFQKQFAAEGNPVPQNQLASFRSSILNAMIGKILMLAEANKLKVTVTDDEVTQQIDSIKSQFQSQDQYLSALAAQGYTEAKLRSEMKDNMIIQKLLTQEVFSKHKIAADAAKNFYDQNPSYFAVADTVTAKQILIKVDPNANDADKKAAMSKITALKKQLDNGADFAELAQKNSDDPSAAKGGDMGSFSKSDSNLTPVQQAAFALKKGQMSDIITDDQGYHIVLVTDRVPAHTQPFADVKSSIEQYLQQDMDNKEAQTYMDGLKSGAKIEMFTDTSGTQSGTGSGTGSGTQSGNSNGAGSSGSGTNAGAGNGGSK